MNKPNIEEISQLPYSNGEDPKSIMAALRKIQMTYRLGPRQISRVANLVARYGHEMRGYFFSHDPEKIKEEFDEFFKDRKETPCISGMYEIDGCKSHGYYVFYYDAQGVRSRRHRFFSTKEEAQAYIDAQGARPDFEESPKGAQRRRA